MRFTSNPSELQHRASTFLTLLERVFYLLSSLLSPLSPLCFLILSLPSHTHPIQAAQVLDLVLITRCFIVDDGVLLIHTAGL